MSWVLTIAGWVQIVAGVLMFTAARSTFHETTAAIALGFGVVAIGLGRMLQYREDDDKRREAEEHGGQNDAPYMIYKAYPIYKDGTWFKAGGQPFFSLDRAKAHIDSLS